MEQQISNVPTAARGPFRIFQMFRFRGCGRDELRADLMTCELGDGRCLAVARILTELQAHERNECAAALANGIFCQFAINQDRLTLLLERGRNGARVALARVRFVRRDTLNVRSKGTWPVRDEDLKFERLPTPNEWPGEWWKMASAPPPLPDTSPLLDLDRAFASMGEVLNKLGAAEPAGARESAFGDATIGELLGRVEAKRAAGERAGRSCVEQIPLAQVSPGPEASLADLVAGLVRDDAGGGAAGSFITPRVIDLPWRGFVVLQPCRVRPYWSVYGKLRQDLHPDRLQVAHPLAIDGAPLRLRTELSVRGYVPCDGWIEEAAHRGLEIWRQPNAPAGYPNPRDAYSSELRALNASPAGPRFEVPNIGDPFPASIVDKINTGTWPRRKAEGRP